MLSTYPFIPRKELLHRSIQTQTHPMHLFMRVCDLCIPSALTPISLSYLWLEHLTQCEPQFQAIANPGPPFLPRPPSFPLPRFSEFILKDPPVV